MSADPHWRNLQEIFLAAIELAPGERRNYLDRACGQDSSLRDAVESLLKSHSETGFIDQPAYLSAADMFLNAADFKPGQTVAHFKILSLLGEGGIGKIFLAQDTKLHRKVALKFLPAKLAEDQDRIRRFVQEAKSA